MEFRILGPLEVLERGEPLELGGPKQRALLAALLLEANRVVPATKLIDALWEDDPPETAQKALQVYVSQLRKLLGRETLLTKAPGYRLRVVPDDLDLTHFLRLVEDGQFHEALGLWRGPALADLAGERFAIAEGVRLEELRLACLEERIDRDLKRGLDAELVGELEWLVHEHPRRERLVVQLMLALYRAGRQADALEVYQRARRLLDELGIEPGRQLRDLHRQVLNQDAALELIASPTGEETERVPEEPRPSSRATATQESHRTRKWVSVVFVGVTVASDGDHALDPELQRRVSDQALRTVDSAVTHHGGSVESVSVEAVTAVFGLPAVHEDDALRAVRAAQDIRARLSEVAVSPALELECRIGVSTGLVLTAPDDAGLLQTSGQPLALAARLGRDAERGEILLDDATWQRVRHAADADGERDRRRLLEISTGAAVPERRLHSPMVGRDRERRRLRDAFDQAAEDRLCQLFTVLGTAGVGKSRLAREFLSEVEASSRTARGRCLPYGEGITFWPLLEVVKELVGLDDSDSSEVAHGKLVAALQSEPGAESVAARVAELIGLTEVRGRTEEGFAAVLQLFTALARDTPLIVVLDDIHWGEPTFLDLVEHVADLARDASILLLCLARPELMDVRPGWGGGKLNATAALLEPLSREECAELIGNLVGATRLASEAESRIADAAEGNPLFVEEMLSMLIDEGVLTRTRDGWVAQQEVTAMAMPPTIHALLSARLDRLHETERAVIERAAVAGKVFQESAIIELSGSDTAVVQTALAALIRKELIRPERAASLGERAFRFRHLLIRDAAYDSIPKSDRATLHERFARWLERTAGGRSTEYEELLGYHFEQAYAYRAELGLVDAAAHAVAREAADRLGSAGRRALLRSDGPAGVNLISRAVALLSPEDPQRVELVPNLRVVQGLGIELAWADRVLTEAVEAAATSGDRRLAAHALVQRGLLRLFTDSDVTSGELLESAERALAVFRDLGDELGQARAFRLEAQAHYLGRRAGLCLEASEQALGHARAARDRFEEWEIAEWLAIALFLGPTPAPEGARRCKQLEDEFADMPLFQAMLLAGRSLLVAMQSDVAEAYRLQEASRRIMGGLGEWVWIASFWSAFLDIWCGKPARAEEILRPGYDSLKRLGSKSHFTSLAHALASATYAQGRYDEAEQLAIECKEMCRPNDIHSQVLWRSIRAKVQARRGLFREAELLAREAVAYASTSDFLPAHADALADLAEVLLLKGDEDNAGETLQEAIRLYELKGNTLAAAQARLLPRGLSMH